ncbi:MAG: biotin carboxylase [Gammaproteobacteria bacterium]|nr:biotin carboxylase [Gammaproteobacteria bacterium]
MFDRVFIANRATVARRVVRACEALGVATVAAYADIDSAAPHLAEATDTARLPGYLAADTYLNGAKLIELAHEAGCDALHPGYGFLAENAVFAREVAEAGLCFIGPDPHWIERLGDKTKSRAAMAEAGFPVRPGSDDLDVEALIEAARRIGFPVLLKPAAGGGGIGMIRVDAETELAEAFATARAQALHAFGDDRVYLESWLDRPRHIEFQVVGDGDTTVGVLERECSVQRRHQKVIEEAPAPGLDRTRLAEVEALAANALTGYDSLGTVETLHADGGFGFLEVNTRLQVEHGVTEEITGVDLVEAQIRIAAGAKLPDVLTYAPEPNGHAVEARIYAEDSRRMLPSTGRLTVYRPPQMTGVRVESGYAEGQWITPYFDPLLAKVIGTGATREQAIGRTLVGVKAFDIRGIDTNRALLERVLGSEPFIAGRLHTGLLDDLL